MATADRITMIIEGLPEDLGRVRFATFMAQLQSLSATLNRIDRDANEGKNATYFEVAELSYNSPIRVVLEAKQARGQPVIGGAVLASLGRIAVALSGDDDLSKVDADLLDDLRRIARPVGRQIRSAALSFNGTTFELDNRVAARIDSALAVEEECDGSIEGMLEQINIHSGANVFHVFPVIGPRKVTCHFPGRLYDDAVSSVGRRVEVFGILRYRAGADFPHQIAVSEIDVAPPEHELADWEDLRGIAPDATGELSSEAFIRVLRDAW